MLERKKKILWGLIALLPVLLLAFGQRTYAENEKNSYYIAKENSGGENTNENTSFFDLKMKPGETRTIETKITNPSKEAMVVKNQIFSAYTNANGEIDYTALADKYDETLKIKLHDICKVQASDILASIPAESSTVVKATITLPEDAQKGVILGSWFFDKEGQIDEKEKNSGVKLNSKYTYALAIKITVGGEIEVPNLNLMSVQIGLLNYKKAFFATIQNDQSALVTNLEFSGYVTKKGKLDVLYKNDLQDRTMAPNSNYQFPILLEEGQFEKGEYTYHLTATTTDPKWQKKTWEWSKDFTILAEEAQKQNAKAINDIRPPKDYTLLIIASVAGAVALLLLISSLIFFLLRKKRKKEEEDEMVEEDDEIARLEKEIASFNEEDHND